MIVHCCGFSGSELALFPTEIKILTKGQYSSYNTISKFAFVRGNNRPSR